METFSALLAICAGNSPVYGEFPAQRPVTRSFDVFFDLRLNKRLSKQSWGWWLETPSFPLWRHPNEYVVDTPHGPFLSQPGTHSFLYHQIIDAATGYWALQIKTRARFLSMAEHVPVEWEGTFTHVISSEIAWKLIEG